MADDSFESLRLSLMQDFLPVGIAMVERVKEGGASKVMEVFTDSQDPFNELRVEGEPVARSLRDRLDQVSPGLGNPVMQVKVEVDDQPNSDVDISDQKSLMKVLSRIEAHMLAVEAHLNDNSIDVSSLVDNE